MPKLVDSVCTLLYLVESVLSVEVLSARIGFEQFLNVHRVSYPFSVNEVLGLEALLVVCSVLIVLELARGGFKPSPRLWLATTSLATCLTAWIFPAALVLNALSPAVYAAMCRSREVVERMIYAVFLLSVAQYLPMVGAYLGGAAWCGLELVSAVTIPIALASWCVSLPLSSGVDGYAKRGSETRLDALRALLAVSLILLGTVIYALPYTKYLNPYAKPVSVDTWYYLRYLHEVEEKGLGVTFERFSFGLDRPLFLLLVYAVSRVASDYLSIALVSVASHALLLFSAWLLAYWIYGYEASIIALVLASVSSQTLAFMYAGFNANHLALALLYLSYAFAIRRRYLSSAVLQAIAAFTHAWSWLQLSAALMLLLIAKLLRGDRGAAIGIAAVAATAFARQVVGNGITNVLKISPTLVLHHVAAHVSSWATLYAMTTFYVWGVLNNPVAYVTAAIDRALELDDLTPIYVATFIAFALNVSSLCITLRTLLNVPIYVSSASLISKRVKSKTSKILLSASFVPSFVYFLLNAVPRS